MSETTVRLTCTTTLSVLTCGECAVPFAIPKNLHAKVRRTGQRFWCPNGHHISYGETENDRLKARAERAEARVTHERDQRLAAERSASAYKGRVTRLKNRAAAGVCPCCNRSFENLRRHMATKHPDFSEAADG